MSSGECFICGRPAPPVPEGFHTRASCNDCRVRARLLPSGAAIAQILAPGERGQLPLDGLSPVLNPLAIDAYRVWAGFAEGDFLVFEQRERSGDWFDFVVQHLEPGPQLLMFIQERKPDPNAPVDSVKLLAEHFADRISVWARLWLLTVAREKALGERGPIQSAADVWEVLDAISKEPVKLDEASARSMLERLYRLADVDWEDAGFAAS